VRALPPSLPEAYEGVPLQVLVREVPHALEVLREGGVRVEERGCEALKRLGGFDPKSASALRAWVEASL